MKKFIFVFKHHFLTFENMDRPHFLPKPPTWRAMAGSGQAGRRAPARPALGLVSSECGGQAAGQSHTPPHPAGDESWFRSISHLNFTVTGTDLEFFN